MSDTTAGKEVEFEFLPGDEVQIEPIDRPAEVDVCMVGHNRKEYRVVYWDDGKRQIEWVGPRELRPR